MSAERTIEREVSDDDIEKEAERFVELEDDIRNARENTSGEEEDVDIMVDATATAAARRVKSGVRRVKWWSRTGVRRASVVSSERLGTKVSLRIEVDGEIRERRVPFPDDPTDGREPLVRLCRWAGVSPDRIADLDAVPVVGKGDRVEVLVPPGRDENRVEIRLPGGFPARFSIESLESKKRRWMRRFQRVLLLTPVLQGRPGNMEAGAGRALGGSVTIGFVALVAGVTVGQLALGVGGGIIGGLLGVLLGAVVFSACADADFGDDFDTFRH